MFAYSLANILLPAVFFLGANVLMFIHWFRTFQSVGSVRRKDADSFDGLRLECGASSAKQKRKTSGDKRRNENLWQSFES